MSAIVINPAHGVAGDMLAAALCALAGPDVLDVVAPLGGVTRVGLREVARHGIVAHHLEVELADATATGSIARLREQLGRTRLGTVGISLAGAALDLIEEAEQWVHGGAGSLLHELGTLDTVVDLALVAGACEQLGVDRCRVEPIGVGTQTVTMSHGSVPSPAPAVARLLERSGLAVRFLPDVGETATPTGVALLAALACAYPLPSSELRVRQVAWGAGTADPASRANVCQVMVVEEQAAGEEVAVIEVHLDDQPGELIALLLAEVLDAGALDAWAVPSVGKKGRPSVEVVVLAPPSLEVELVGLTHRLTGSPGVRWRRQWRSRLLPRMVAVPLGSETVHVKVTDAGAKPEFDELVRAARALGITPGEARDRVMARYVSDSSIGS